MTSRTSSSRTHSLSNEKLTEMIVRCEEAVTKGTAQMRDYETFVWCAEELTRRTSLLKTG